MRGMGEVDSKRRYKVVPRASLMRFRCGPDLMRGEGWSLTLGLISRPDLMRWPEEQGMYVLTALELNLYVRLPWEHVRGHALDALNGRPGVRWRSPLRFWVRSDAAEIAERIAGNAGQVEGVTLAVAGEFPFNWMNLRVRDLTTGREVQDVVAVDTRDGWVERYVKDGAPKDGFYVHRDGRAVTERTRGWFRIERRG